MSAYALPGLFPPLQHSLAKGVSSSSSVEKAAVKQEDENDHVEKHVTQSLQEKESNSGCLVMPYTCPSPGAIVIAVKEARIDSMRLIQALTSNAATTLQRSTFGRFQKRKQGTVVEKEKEIKFSPQEGAMQFDLSITFNGRKYTAVRSLPRILQLRQDLVEEVKERRHSVEQHYKCKELDSLTIPELPRMYEGCDSDMSPGGATGFVARSFSMLQSLLCSYVPVLEVWLHNVTSLVQPVDSPILRQFLWEPLSLSVKQLESGCDNFQFAELTAIEESEEAELLDDEDDQDEN